MRHDGAAEQRSRWPGHELVGTEVFDTHGEVREAPARLSGRRRRPAEARAREDGPVRPRHASCRSRAATLEDDALVIPFLRLTSARPRRMPKGETCRHGQAPGDLPPATGSTRADSARQCGRAPSPVIALIDGEHHPSAVREALDALERERGWPAWSSAAARRSCAADVLDDPRRTMAAPALDEVGPRPVESLRRRRRSPARWSTWPTSRSRRRRPHAARGARAPPRARLRGAGNVLSSRRATAVPPSTARSWP